MTGASSLVKVIVHNDCYIIIIKIERDMLSVEELNDRLIDLAFAEDIGDGDHTTLCCIPETEMGESKLLIKQPGIFFVV